MDDLINKIRGNNKSEKVIKNESNTECENETFGDSFLTQNDTPEENNHILEENNQILEEEHTIKLETQNAGDSSNLIIRTSQPEALQTNYNVLFNLNKLKNLNSDFIKVKDILKIKEFRVGETFYLIIKTKETFRDIFRLVLADETGEIVGHTNIENLGVGDILELNDCSLWKNDSNELNIIHENLLKIMPK